MGGGFSIGDGTEIKYGCYQLMVMSVVRGGLFKCLSNVVLLVKSQWPENRCEW